MVHATTLFEVSRGEIHGRQFALFIKFMQCFFKVSASATADDCIALHCIALVFTCKILMINKRGRCFNHDPVSPSKTLLERTSLAWKHRSMESNFRYSFWRWLAAASAACCKHGSRTTRRNLLRLPLQSLSMPCFAEAEIWTQKSRDFIHFPLKQRSSARSQIMKLTSLSLSSISQGWNDVTHH